MVSVPSTIGLGSAQPIGVKVTAQLKVALRPSRIEVLSKIVPTPNTRLAAVVCNWLRQLGKVNEVNGAHGQFYYLDPSTGNWTLRDALIYTALYMGTPATPHWLTGINPNLCWSDLYAYLVAQGYSTQNLSPQPGGDVTSGVQTFMVATLMNVLPAYQTWVVEFVTLNTLTGAFSYSVTTAWTQKP